MAAVSGGWPEKLSTVPSVPCVSSMAWLPVMAWLSTMACRGGGASLSARTLGLAQDIHMTLAQLSQA